MLNINGTGISSLFISSPTGESIFVSLYVIFSAFIKLVFGCGLWRSIESSCSLRESIKIKMHVFHWQLLLVELLLLKDAFPLLRHLLLLLLPLIIRFFAVELAMEAASMSSVNLLS
jgi:hypothetical protein